MKDHRPAHGWRKTDGWFVATVDEAVACDGGPCLLSPLTATLPAHLADMACALPIGDANGQVLDALRHDPRPTPWVFAAVLAGDPFRRTDDLLDALTAEGVSGVINWPSVGFLSGELGAALVQSGFTYALELEMLARAQQRGLATAAVVSDKEQIRAATASQPDMMLLAPGFITDEVSKPAAGLSDFRELLQEAAAQAPNIERRAYLHPAYPDLIDTPPTRVDGLIRRA